MNRILSTLTIAIFVLTLTGCGPKEKHFLSGAAFGIAVGVAGVIALDRWRKS